MVIFWVTIQNVIYKFPIHLRARLVMDKVPLCLEQVSDSLALGKTI